MEWIDYAVKGIGFLVALGTFTKLAIEIYKVIKNGGSVIGCKQFFV